MEKPNIIARISLRDKVDITNKQIRMDTLHKLIRKAKGAGHFREMKVQVNVQHESVMDLDTKRVYHIECEKNTTYGKKFILIESEE